MVLNELNLEDIIKLTQCLYAVVVYDGCSEFLMLFTLILYQKGIRGVRPSKVDNSSGSESRSGKVGQPPDSKHRAGGGNSKC